MFDYPRVSNKFILGPLGTSPPPPQKKNVGIKHGNLQWFSKVLCKRNHGHGFSFLGVDILTDSMALALSTE